MIDVCNSVEHLQTSSSLLNGMEQSNDSYPKYEIMSEKKAFPEYLQLEYSRGIYQTWLDESDSSFFYTGVNNGDTSRVLTGYYDFPKDFRVSYNGGTPVYQGFACGVCQWVPGFKGTFKIDTVRIYAFVLASSPKAKKDYTFLPISMPSLNLTDTAALRKSRGIRIDFNKDAIEYYENNMMAIPADTLNNRLIYTGNTVSSIKYTFMKMSPQIVLPPNKNIGFMVYQQDVADGASTDSVRIVGDFEWQLTDQQTYGCIIRRDAATDTIESSYRWNRFWQPPFDVVYAPLHKKNVKVNYEMVLFGEYEPSFVEQTSDDTSGLTLEQNSPNPAVDNTLFTFSNDKSDYISINLFNSLGQKVLNIANGYYNAGTYKASCDVSDLPPGSYYYSINSANKSITKAMQIIR
jgi:hypothetical protein